MLHKLRTRAQDEKGFTLIELLVVILIIGILAAIALPAFLGQQKKGQDSEAKSNARNIVSHIESCFAETQTYANCMPGAANTQFPTDTGLSIGSDPGQVTAAVGAAPIFYTVTATSKADENGTNHSFSIRKTTNGNVRLCAPAGKGGCKSAADSQGNSW